MGGGDLSKLVELMAYLRSPQGCPWDRAQNYDTLKPMVLEEAYEVVDAVNERDFDGLEEELGDLLFQVVFYSRLAEEEGRFSIDGVAERVHSKLVRRHPHVFGPNRAGDAQQALKSWNQVKEDERRARTENAEPSPGGDPPPADAGRQVAATAKASLLAGIPRTLPSALEAHELGVRAAEAGFDWVRVEDLLAKIEEEAGELREELRSPRYLTKGRELGGDGTSHPAPSRDPGQARIEEEIGDLLFAASNLARYLGSDAETCLRRANRKFKRRFQALEAEVAKRGKRVQDSNPEELDAIWNLVKSAET